MALVAGGVEETDARDNLLWTEHLASASFAPLSCLGRYGRPEESSGSIAQHMCVICTACEMTCQEGQGSVSA